MCIIFNLLNMAKKPFSFSEKTNTNMHIIYAITCCFLVRYEDR